MTRAQLLSMDAQVWWRFASYREWPCKLALLVDPRNTFPLDTAREFFETPSCCRDADFSGKVIKLFATPEAMLSDSRFMHTLRTWVMCTKVTNMHVERLFALLKRGLGPTTSKQRPDIERLVACGTLCQWLFLKDKWHRPPNNCFPHPRHRVFEGVGDV